MKHYEFQWPGSKRERRFQVAEDKMENLEVYNFETQSMGEITYVNNRLAILWADGSDNTYLDTDEGLEVLKHCKPY